MEKQLKELKSFEEIQLPQYDFTTHTRKDYSVAISPKKIIIVEGLLLLSEPLIRDLLDIKVYVDTPDDIRLIRRMARDQKERGRTVEGVIAQYLATVRPMHNQFIEPSKRYADVIIPEDGENQMAIDIIISNLREQI